MSRPTSPRAAWWFRSRSRCRRMPAFIWFHRRRERTRRNSPLSGNGSSPRCRTKPEKRPQCNETSGSIGLFPVGRAARTWQIARPIEQLSAGETSFRTGQFENGEKLAMPQPSMSQPPQIKNRIGAILRATSGNFLEQFDFFLFGFYAPYIAKAFFPSENETAALLNTFGAIWLGAYIDRIGRRLGLIVTLAIMAAGTVIITICPTYATIGVAAPVIVLLGRLLQGFSAGIELGGVSVYLAEIATPGNRGFYTSFQSSSQQVAIFVAALIGFTLNAMMP